MQDNASKRRYTGILWFTQAEGLEHRSHGR